MSKDGNEKKTRREFLKTMGSAAASFPLISGLSSRKQGADSLMKDAENARNNKSRHGAKNALE